MAGEVKVVPLEATPEMVAAGYGKITVRINGDGNDLYDVYRAMLAAAPAPTDEDPTTPEAQAGSEAVAWQWRSRIIGGAWDAWENGRYGHVPPPFMEVEERQIPPSPPDATYWKGAYERMAARNVELDNLLCLYREAVSVDVKMECPRFMGANSSALRRAWIADQAALATLNEAQSANPGGSNG